MWIKKPGQSEVPVAFIMLNGNKWKYLKMKGNSLEKISRSGFSKKWQCYPKSLLYFWFMNCFINLIYTLCIKNDIDF